MSADAPSLVGPPPPPVEVTPGVAAAWRQAIGGVLADPDQLRVVFQPIVDLSLGTIAGYEALARIEAPVAGVGRRLTPDLWFVAADANGLGAELEGLVVAKALTHRNELPPNSFLTINVSPHLLGTAELDRAFGSVDHLANVVIELTEHVAFDDLRALTEQTRRLRAAGALIAVDDAGSGYAGLQQILELRPQLIKLDRALVAGVDLDPARAALAELLGEFAGRIDAWLLAEGIETPGELATFSRMGVPLGQGYLLGRPVTGMQPLDADVHLTVRSEAARVSMSESIAGVMRTGVTVLTDSELRLGPVTAVSAAARLGGEPVVVAGDGGVPIGIILTDPRDGTVRTVAISLRVLASDPAADVLMRALTRPPESRYDPIVCTDTWGRVVGVTMLDDLTRQVVRGHSA